MTYLTPILAGVAAAIAIPSLIILYFLKLRRRNVEISTTLLWKKAIQDLQANAPFQRLRRNILLLLQLLILGGMLFAIAQPQISRIALDSQRHIILIDRSASMSSNDEPDGRGGFRSRLDAAKEQALALVASLREGSAFATAGVGGGDEAMIIAFDASAAILQNFTSDKARLSDAIRSIQPTDARTSIEEALRLVRAQGKQRVITDTGSNSTITSEELFSDDNDLALHLWSDGRISDLSAAKPGPERSFEYHQVGKAGSGNVAITSIRAERSFDDPKELSIFVGLQNNEAIERAIDVELRVNDTTAQIRAVLVPKAAMPIQGGDAADAATAITPGVGGTVFKLDRPEAALIQVTLRQPSSPESPAGDVLATDNRAWLVVPPAKRMSVALVSDGDLFLESLLSVLRLSKVDTMSLAQFEKLASQGKATDYDVVVLDRVLPKVALTPSGLPPGRYIVFGSIPTGPEAPLQTTGEAGSQGFLHWNREHPVLDGADLDPVNIAESRQVSIAPGGGAITLAMGDKGPLMLEVTTPDTHAIVTAFHPLDSTWPWNVSYVVVGASMVSYMGEGFEQGVAARMVSPGSVISDRLPSDAKDITIDLPGNEKESLALSPDARVTFGPVGTSGVYRMTWDGSMGPSDITVGGRAARYFTANLLDGAESDTRAASTIALPNKNVEAAARSSSDGNRPLWPWILLGALAIIMLEWFVYNRKVQV
ncbi:MAG: BatA and WFA domain-containing protein [Phycisphaerales bacterium]|nr:MAG: BatA and WFA domain-containing protein [Phycisphaerales bacterium]